MKTGTLFILCFNIMAANAQQATLSAGGNATGSGGSVSYSIGQILYTTNNGTIGTVAQGVQQPYEISVLSGIDNFIIGLSISIYPNPTSDILVLSIGNFDISKMTYQLFDSRNGLIDSKKIINNPQFISMQNLAGGLYFLRVINNNKNVKTFKIVKI